MPRSRRPRPARALAATLLALAALTAAPAYADSTGSAAHLAAADAARLPGAVNAPGTWSTGRGVHGPVAALGIATRTRPVGLFDHTEHLALFAVSATDGHATWLHLPGFNLHRWGFAGGFDVSPDGAWIGWVLPQHPTRPHHARIAGFAVLNTTTGQIRHLTDPHFDRVRPTMADLTFSGDSRYLLTSYETPDQPEVRGHQFVAFDVETGAPTVLEEPGHYWLPNPGSAPTGVVWARGHHVYRADPATGTRATVTLPHDVITASWGPDDTAFAYLGRPSVGSHAPWRLYAGRTLTQARDRAVDLPADMVVSQLLGWRDPTHVVVGHYRTTVYVVDIGTGAVETLDLAGYGDQVNAPYLAGGLWDRPLGTATPPEGTSDPRRPWRRAGAGLLLAAGAGVLWTRRTRTRRTPATGPDTDPDTEPGH